MVPINKRPTWVIASGAAVAITAAGVTGIALASGSGSDDDLPGPIKLRDRIAVQDTDDGGTRSFDVVPNPIVTGDTDSPFNDLRFNADVTGQSQDAAGPVGTFDDTGDTAQGAGVAGDANDSPLQGGAPALDADSHDSPFQAPSAPAPVAPAADDSVSLDSPDDSD